MVVGGDSVERPHLVSDSEDDVSLVQLNRDFLSDTQFGKIVDRVQDSPFSCKLVTSITIRPHTSVIPTVSDQEAKKTSVAHGILNSTESVGLGREGQSIMDMIDRPSKAYL